MRALSNTVTQRLACQALGRWILPEAASYVGCICLDGISADEVCHDYINSMVCKLPARHGRTQHWQPWVNSLTLSSSGLSDTWQAYLWQITVSKTHSVSKALFKVLDQLACPSH